MKTARILKSNTTMLLLLYKTDQQMLWGLLYDIPQSQVEQSGKRCWLRVWGEFLCSPQPPKPRGQLLFSSLISKALVPHLFHHRVFKKDMEQERLGRSPKGWMPVGRHGEDVQCEMGPERLPAESLPSCVLTSPPNSKAQLKDMASRNPSTVFSTLSKLAEVSLLNM